MNNTQNLNPKIERYSPVLEQGLDQAQVAKRI